MCIVIAGLVGGSKVALGVASARGFGGTLSISAVWAFGRGGELERKM